jgi:hypothetical protein
MFGKPSTCRYKAVSAERQSDVPRAVRLAEKNTADQQLTFVNRIPRR